MLPDSSIWLIQTSFTWYGSLSAEIQQRQHVLHLLVLLMCVSYDKLVNEILFQLVYLTVATEQFT